MQNELNIVAIQAKLSWENPAANLEFFEHKIAHLDSDTDLIVLPEMFSTGFTMQPTSIAQTMKGSAVLWMIATARVNNVAIVGSIVVQENHQYFNRAIFVHPNGLIETYDKRHLFSLAGEDILYTPGSTLLIVHFKGWRICPLICYDLRFPVWSRNTNNYDLLLFMANWP
ncbi:MAG: nitrilase-related carbon-nitrogen hydrolase, partial [Flavobacteriaceae bacterium]|nr:nitrilase-related carbon-nitrogen hydrolase [Flavobacteriaceae bacterium]